MILAFVFLLAQFLGWNGIPIDGNLPLPGWTTPYTTNPYTTALCPTEPCASPVNGTVDANSASQITSIFTQVGSFSMGVLQVRQPGTTGGGATPFPIYFSSLIDPLYTVTCDGGTTNCTGAPSTVHIPNGARAGNSFDHHVIVISPSMQECDTEQFNDGGTGTGSTNPVYGGGALSVKGMGCATSLTMFNNGGSCTTCSGTSGGLPLQPTMLDPLELMNGSINHTLSLALYCPSSSHYWPATKSDGPCPTGPGEGARIWLNLSLTQIAALGYCSWETTLLDNMHQYGWLIVGTGSGPGPWGFYHIDDGTQMLWGGAGNWSSFFTWLSSSCPSANPAFAASQSHLVLNSTGLSASDLEIVEQNVP